MPRIRRKRVKVDEVKHAFRTAPWTHVDSKELLDELLQELLKQKRHVWQPGIIAYYWDKYLRPLGLHNLSAACVANRRYSDAAPSPLLVPVAVNQVLYKETPRPLELV